MKKIYTFISVTLFFLCAGTAVYFYLSTNLKEKDKKRATAPEEEEEKREFGSDEGRDQYFLKMLQDPKTGRIPSGIRYKELKFAETLNKLNKLSGKTSQQEFKWQEAGPYDVGGRTRALAVDVTNSSVIIAGGISGGIWKSIDNGSSWTLKNTSSQVLNVTSVAQDPRPGFNNIWYYATGEYRGNTASDYSHNAVFTGDGIYKSTDNGESWFVLPSTLSRDPSSWDSYFDYVNKIIVSPVSGSVFVAANGYGIFRSDNGGDSFSLIMGGQDEHLYNNIDIAKNGTILAAIGSAFPGRTPAQKPGIYKSNDNGATWDNLTPADLTDFNGSAVAIAPSNPNTAFVLINTNNFIPYGNGTREVNSLYKLNLADGTSENLSANLPDFNFNYNDWYNSYNSYAMVIGIKPDDENLVLIGGSSLFRSFDGFRTKPADSRLSWIGGYHNGYPWIYPNLHADVHALVFDPKDPQKLWCGNDGGLSYITDITDQSYEVFMPWQSKNHGYNVTQFYMVTMTDRANDNRIMGGTQDNGTPFFTRENNQSSGSSEAGNGGDGGFAYFGNDFAYTSTQNGTVERVRYDQAGTPSSQYGLSRIDPLGASNALWVTPYAVDPADENIMYYPAGGELWRNNQLSNLPDRLNQTSTGWTHLTGLSAPQGYIISALSVSKNPQHILYYGAYSQFNSPILYRLQEANTALTGAEALTIPNAPARSYIHSIAVNPDNADEIMVVLSNYNIMGLYYSQDGGKTLQAIAGNLQGNVQNPGPSLRSATILPGPNGNIYFVGTSIGVFSTTQLNGANTQWVQQSPDQIGNVVVNHITSRKSDMTVLAGTHGRGAFIAKYSEGGNAVLSLRTNQLEINVQPDKLATIPFTIDNTGNANLNYSIAVSQGGGQLKKGSLAKAVIKQGMKKELSVSAQDSLYNDDGNNLPDNFFGNSQDFYWVNVFDVAKDFSLENVDFYMRTETAENNSLYFSVSEFVNNQFSAPISEANLTAPVYAGGTWFDYKLDQPLKLTGGKSYAITIGSIGTVPYPAGFDKNGSKPGKAYYWNAVANQWNTLQSANYPNGAWLIRIYGSYGSNTQARLNVDPPNGVIAPNASATENVTYNAQGLQEGTYKGQLKITSNGGNALVDVTVKVSTAVVGVEKSRSLPTDYKIDQNYPNPFNPTTNINFEVPVSGEVQIKIFDSAGREITTLTDNIYPAGRHSIQWNGTNSSGAKLPSGIYIYSMRSGSFNSVRKMVMLK